MRERTAGDRIRVAIAGNIYAKRALVRRFLEDDGFSVVAEANDRDELFSSISAANPDAVVLDDDAADWDFEEIREPSPEVKIVLFTSGSPDAPTVPPGADGYLQKGEGLGRLTALLRDLLAEPPGPAALPPPPVRIPGGPEHERGVLLRLGAIAAAIVLVAVGALALIGPRRPANQGTQPTSSPTAPPVKAPNPLTLAQADLRDLQKALGEGRYADATVLARFLMRDRLAAVAHGFQVGELDRAISLQLGPLMGTLSPAFISTLQGILGALLPPLPVLPIIGGGGGIIVTGGGGTTQPNGGGGGGTTQPSGGGGGGTEPGGGGGTEPGGGGGTEPGGGGSGQGKHNGWQNKPPDGGWHGENPKRHGPNGHSQGHSQAHGKRRGKD